MNYAELLNIRTEKVDDVELWLWIKKDMGAWTGPRLEWPHFKQRYLKYVKKFDLVVQAGGNLGMYPRLLSDMFKWVYTFEPDSLNFHCLVNNCQKSNIVKFNAALSNSHQMLELNRHDLENAGMHRMSMKAGHTPTLMIDDFDFSDCDLIQLDVEGFEFNALRGGMKTIEKFKPVIAAELGSKQIEDLLKPFGYRKVDEYESDSFYMV
jgi:FkbM family methyltransferase